MNIKFTRTTHPALNLHVPHTQFVYVRQLYTNRRLLIIFVY